MQKIRNATEADPPAVLGTHNHYVLLLDEWWIEACVDGVTGWSISPDSAMTANQSDTTTALYRKLEETILPLYYANAAAWRVMMKQSIVNIAPYFNTHR